MEQLLLHLLTQICAVKFRLCLDGLRHEVCDSRESCAADENAVRGCQLEYQACFSAPKIKKPKKIKLRK